MPEPTDIHALLERGGRGDIAIAAPEREPLTYGALRDQVGRTGDALAQAGIGPRRPGRDRAPQRAGDGGGLSRHGRARHGGPPQPRLPRRRVRLLSRRPAGARADPGGGRREPGHRGGGTGGRAGHRPHGETRRCRLLQLRHSGRGEVAPGNGDAQGRRGAGAPHLGHHVAAQDRAADGLRTSARPRATSPTGSRSSPATAASTSCRSSTSTG